MTSKQPAAGTPASRPVSPGRPPNSEVPARLRHILDVASREFLTHGYAQANIARIARDAGVSKKTIYLRYPSKDDLLMAVAADVASRSHETVMTAMNLSGDEPANVLTSFGGAVARTWAHPEEIGLYRLIVSEAVRFPQLAEIYRQTMARFRQTLTAYLSEQTECGLLAIPDPDAAAHQFGMLVYGEIREDALLGRTATDDDIDAVVQRAVRVFLDGYATASSGRGGGRRQREQTRGTRR